MKKLWGQAMVKQYAVLACGILVSGMFYSCNRLASSSEEINIVKAGTLRSCPNSTIEKMSTAFFTSPKWESGTGPNGKLFVNLSGDMGLNGKSARAVIQFLVNKEKKVFTYHALEIDGKPEPEDVAVDLFKQMCDATLVLTVASEEDVNKTAPGIWTCDWLPTTGKPIWSRVVFNQDKTGEFYLAPITADDWGKSGSMKWVAVSGKYPTTGKRWYGIKVQEEGRKNMGWTIRHGDNDYTYVTSNSLMIFIFDRDDNILSLLIDPHIIMNLEQCIYVVSCNRKDIFPFSK
jgi:hypothetical protein